MKSIKLPRDKKYLLACSYGPDSMALFNLLNTQGVYFDVAIVNYHLRKESDLEVKGLKEYCKKYNKTLYIKDVKESINKNIEKRCREIRYDFFKELYQSNGYDALLVAHHQDDLIETYLLQKSRQNLPKFFGIARKTTIKGMIVIRPLLAFSKDELLEIVNKNNVPYSIDVTNLSDDFLRNKIRHNIVMKMSKNERRIILKEIANKNKEIKAIFKTIKINDIHDISFLTSVDFITYLYAINEMMQKLDSSNFLSKVQGQEILKIIMSDKPNVISKIKTKIFLVKEYDSIRFLSEIIDYQNYSFLIDKPKKLNTQFFYLDFRGDTSNRNVFLDSYPLTVRTAKEDDEIMINGYIVEVRRLFIDWKMPLLIRKQWPIILDKNLKPIYIPRYQKGFKKTKDTNFYVKIK